MPQQAIVILHGWQSNLNHWQPLVEILKKNFRVYFPSLPGFKTKLTCAWSLQDYVNWLEDYLFANKIENPILLGHSFGGRVAIKFVSKKNKVKKLILVASAGIKPKNNLKRIIFLVLAKVGKVFFLLPPFSFFKDSAAWLLYKLAREKDYYQADKFLKLTMENIIRKDWRLALNRIEIPTLILWGKKDKITKVTDAYIFNKEIKNSRLVIFKEGDHGLPFKFAKKVAAQIISFHR